MALCPRGEQSAERLSVTAIVRAYPDEEFPGTISFIYPHVDQETRTVTVRVEISNPGHVLRPGATATVFINVQPRNVPVLLHVAVDNPERINHVLLPPDHAGLARSTLGILRSRRSRRCVP